MTSLFQGAPKGLMLEYETAWKRNSRRGWSSMGLLFGPPYVLILRYSSQPRAGRSVMVLSILTARPFGCFRHGDRENP